MILLILKLSGLFILFFWMVIPENAYAYLDPGTGSYLLQLLIAGLLASSLFLKNFWKNFKMSITNLTSKGRNSSKHDEQK